MLTPSWYERRGKYATQISVRNSLKKDQFLLKNNAFLEIYQEKAPFSYSQNKMLFWKQMSMSYFLDEKSRPF